MVKETYEDGWECVPQLSKASNCLEEARHEKYEIDNCVRETPLGELVVNLKEKLEEAILHLDEIDINVEYKTVEDEE